MLHAIYGKSGTTSRPIVSGITEHDIHILDSLAGSPFDQIVDGGHDNHPAVRFIHIQLRYHR